MGICLNAIHQTSPMDIFINATYVKHMQKSQKLSTDQLSGNVEMSLKMLITHINKKVMNQWTKTPKSLQKN